MQRSLLLGFFFFLFLGVVTGSIAQEGNIVQEVVFEGLQNMPLSEMRGLVTIKKGDMFLVDNINESVKNLFKTGKFEDIRVERERLTNGYRLIYKVKENPYVRWIRFKNPGFLSVEDMKSAIPIKEEGYFTESMISESIAIIKQKYISEGFRDVSIDVQKEPYDVKKRTNAYDITFVVDAKKKVVVEKIIITGNEAVKAGEIKNAMKTKEKFWFVVSGVLKEDEFEEDEKLIQYLYKKKGYFDVKINRHTWYVTNVGKDNHPAIYVEIDIAEGEKYFTGNISIENNTIYSTEDLRSLVSLKEGSVYDYIQMEMGRYAIYSRYADNGYLYANVILIPEKRENTNVIDSRLMIYEGKRAHIEKILITGNTRTKTKVIQRELIFQEGEMYVNRKVEQTKNRLMQLEYFSDVQVNPFPGSAEGLVNLNIDVEETRTGLFTFGVTYGFESGFSAYLQVSEKNFLGTGRTVTARGEWAERRQSISLGFQEPYLFDQPISAGVSLGYSRDWFKSVPTDDDGDGVIDGSDFNYHDNPSNSLTTLTNDKQYYRDSINLGINLGRRFGIYWQGGFSLGTSFYQDTGANFTLPLTFSDHWDTNVTLQDDLKKGWRFRNYFGLSATRNSTDNPFEPTRGSIFQANLTSYGGILGGESHFIKTKFFYSTYFNPIWKIVLAYNISTEFLLPQFMNGLKEYAANEVLRYDGIWELRGWMGLVRGGESKLYNSFELRYQIYQIWVWGVFICDVGNLWSTWSGIAPLNPEGTMFSFGPGIRLNIPGFPLRFYLVRRGYYDSQEKRFRFEKTDEFFSDWQFVFSIQGMF
ncbi:outer membrane protein assembly factor BamA [Thermospira aquatica]|uniref:Outer membrane protein assembly factor BamA n=1 Tax=Thermospira aquatica TaxID=2828656 RepID=A0AAX3BC89_9SPIR|nr:outer membrane protein assembly factor BamA [Thermospira aquatica]URA09875.1 outer membrane protein assembly factor BamA [Thermospira aquatica]